MVLRVFCSVECSLFFLERSSSPNKVRKGGNLIEIINFIYGSDIALELFHEQWNWAYFSEVGVCTDVTYAFLSRLSEM